MAVFATLPFAGCGDLNGSTGSGAVDDPAAATTTRCNVTFRLTNDVALWDLDFRVKYDRAPGAFVGDGADVDCVSLIEATAISRNNRCRGENRACPSGPDRTLYVSLLGNSPFSGPADAVRCAFAGAPAVTADDLDIVNVSASYIDPPESRSGPANVAVSEIDCALPSESSTTSTTSTTLQPCDEPCADGEACFDGACVAVERYELDFHLDDAVTLGAIQIETVYDATRGEIVGAREDTQCWLNEALNAYAVFANDPPYQDPCVDPDSSDPKCFNAPIIGPTGITGPTRLFTCLYEPADPPPAASDLKITVTDAVTPHLQRIFPYPTVSISAIRPVRPSDRAD